MPDPEAVVRKRVWEVARSQVGIRERTNQNDHPQIREYNRLSKVYATAPYCGSGLYWCFVQADVPLPLKGPALVRSWFADSRKIIYKHGWERSLREPQTMDVISIFASHVEAIAPQNMRWDELEDDDYIEVIGFNTTGGRGTPGGVYLVRRKKEDVKLIANHVSPYLDGTYAPVPAKKAVSPAGPPGGTTQKKQAKK